MQKTPKLQSVSSSFYSFFYYNNKNNKPHVSYFILSQKHLRCKKIKAKKVNNLKVWNHCEAKKKTYTSKAV